MKDSTRDMLRRIPEDAANSALQSVLMAVVIAALLGVLWLIAYLGLGPYVLAAVLLFGFVGFWAWMDDRKKLATLREDYAALHNEWRKVKELLAQREMESPEKRRQRQADEARLEKENHEGALRMCAEFAAMDEEDNR